MAQPQSVQRLLLRLLLLLLLLMQSVPSRRQETQIRSKEVRQTEVLLLLMLLFTLQDMLLIQELLLLLVQLLLPLLMLLLQKVLLVQVERDLVLQVKDQRIHVLRMKGEGTRGLTGDGALVKVDADCLLSRREGGVPRSTESSDRSDGRRGETGDWVDQRVRGNEPKG